MQNRSDILNNNFDAVVMLTQSDWFEEPVSNRYYYATRFAQHLPVIFVQPDVFGNGGWQFEDSDTENITLLHVSKTCGEAQSSQINAALYSKGVVRPMLWACSPRFCGYLQARSAPLKVYHAAGDDVRFEGGDDLQGCIDLVVAEAQGMLDDFLSLGSAYHGRALLLTGGDDGKFEELLAAVSAIAVRRTPPKMRVNILYDEATNKVFAVKNYLEMFRRYSHHSITTTSAGKGTVCKPGELDAYDAVVVFFTLRVCFPGHFSPSYADALTAYGGHKLLFVQDDYEDTENTRRSIERLGIKTVFTVMPKEVTKQVYPPKRFPKVTFFNLMTGYISDDMLDYETKPIAQRELLIAYRGRELPYWTGELCREKLVIGQEMRHICEQKGLAVDIEWADDKRIYTNDWLRWLSSAKATLATESGTNVFDYTGRLKRREAKLRAKNPQYTYEAFAKKYLKNRDGVIKTNQVSPKMFEAICLKTVLVMFEGAYSGILQPGVHYIPLKKDFSNVEEVLQKLGDDTYLQRLANGAYADLLAKPWLRYEWMIGFFDACVYAGALAGPAQTVNALKYKLWQLQAFFRRDSVQVFLSLFPEGSRRWRFLHAVYHATVGRLAGTNQKEGGQDGR